MAVCDHSGVVLSDRCRISLGCNRLLPTVLIGVRDGGLGGAVDPPIRADTTFIRAKDKTFVRDHSGKTGFDPPNGCWPVRQ